MIKFGILAGVSSDIQVEDKASIPDQINTCRKAIAQLGGLEIGCWVMDGYSRTGYDSLADAMEDIPPLKEAIEAAAQNQYDVLMLDNWDRLGDLGQLVHTRYKKYRKQIYSARQSGRLHDPATYDPYSDESASIDMHIQGILQSYRLNKLRRGWNLGVAARIESGLPPFRVAYGYTKTGKKTPPVQNENSKYVIQIKDWILEGRPLSWAAEELTRMGVPSPSGRSDRWHPESIRHILLNPFYAGIVAKGQKRMDRTSKHGRRYRQRTPQSEWMQQKGQHMALWDEATYLAIQNEFARRMVLKNYARTVYPLAGVLRCTVCQQKLVRRHISRNALLVPGLGCKHGNSHILQLDYQTAIESLAIAIKQDLHDLHLNPPDPSTERARLLAELEDYQSQRTLVQAGYQAKIYRTEEASQMIAELERLEKTAKQQMDELQHAAESLNKRQSLVRMVGDMEQLAEWIRDDDPAIVNQILSTLCQTVWVDPGLQFRIEWRQ